MPTISYDRLSQLYAMADLYAPCSRKLVIEWAAKTAKVREGKVERWLSGDAQPTADQLEALEEAAWAGVHRRANAQFSPVEPPRREREPYWRRLFR